MLAGDEPGSSFILPQSGGIFTLVIGGGLTGFFGIRSTCAVSTAGNGVLAAPDAKTTAAPAATLATTRMVEMARTDENPANLTCATAPLSRRSGFVPILALLASNVK